MLKQEILQKELTNSIKWIADYVQKTGAKGVVIGNSGGKDCAAVIAMAVKALGADRVLAVAMPCKSIAADLEDAKLVANTFKVTMLQVDLTNANKILEENIVKGIQQIGKTSLGEEAKINMKPRLRMTTLYAIAQTLGYLVIGTGNLCERMVGYTTKWGDNSSDFNPIANFTVEEVYEIGKILGVPDKIIHKVPSDGLGSKTDEEKMGITYQQIAEYIETGNTDEQVKEKIQQRYENSKHKREEIPMYKIKRINYLEKKE